MKDIYIASTHINSFFLSFFSLFLLFYPCLLANGSDEAILGHDRHTAVFRLNAHSRDILASTQLGRAVEDAGEAGGVGALERATSGDAEAFMVGDQHTFDVVVVRPMQLKRSVTEVESESWRKRHCLRDVESVV